MEVQMGSCLVFDMSTLPFPPTHIMRRKGQEGWMRKVRPAEWRKGNWGWRLGALSWGTIGGRYFEDWSFDWDGTYLATPGTQHSLKILFCFFFFFFFNCFSGHINQIADFWWFRTRWWSLGFGGVEGFAKKGKQEKFLF